MNWRCARGDSGAVFRGVALIDVVVEGCGEFIPRARLHLESVLKHVVRAVGILAGVLDTREQACPTGDCLGEPVVSEERHQRLSFVDRVPERSTSRYNTQADHSRVDTKWTRIERVLMVILRVTKLPWALGGDFAPHDGDQAHVDLPLPSPSRSLIISTFFPLDSFVLAPLLEPHHSKGDHGTGNECTTDLSGSVDVRVGRVEHGAVRCHR